MELTSRFQARPAVLERGQYVVFTHFRYPQQYLIKQIKGVAGDTIMVQGGHLTIGKNTLPLLPRTREGEPLYPLSTRVVPQGFVFVAGTHSQSFDSRYKGFGLVHLSQIKGRVWPLF